METLPKKLGHQHAGPVVLSIQKILVDTQRLNLITPPHPHKELKMILLEISYNGESSDGFHSAFP